jgi:hypothetical protein
MEGRDPQIESPNFRLRDVSPCTTVNDVIHRYMADTDRPGHCALRLASSDSRSDFLDPLRVKFGGVFPTPREMEFLVF